MKLLIASIALCFAVTTTAQISSTEKQALLDLYHSTNGPEWSTGWDLETSEDSWFGVEIKNNTVVSIDLGFNNLKGEIPQSIGNLENLQSLKLFFNQINGSLPAEIGNLKNLKVLDLNSNAITGNIPSEIGNLVHLKELLLSSNNFTGTLPSAIGSLDKLETLVLFDNHLYGDFPVAIASMENLKELIIASNNFNSESLQTSLATLSLNGTVVDFDENKSIHSNNSEFAILVMDEDN
tara:strand:+ start:35280 stop:35990 length:711 start_codon:yes stop_codon:yes gene_type:complete